MTIAIVLAGVALYIGLAVVVGRFCGLNSAWERAAQGAIGPKETTGATDPLEIEVLEMNGAGFDPVPSEDQEEETPAQMVQ